MGFRFFIFSNNESAGNCKRSRLSKVQNNALVLLIFSYKSKKPNEDKIEEYKRNIAIDINPPVNILLRRDFLVLFKI